MIEERLMRLRISASISATRAFIRSCTTCGDTGRTGSGSSVTLITADETYCGVTRKAQPSSHNRPGNRRRRRHNFIQFVPVVICILTAPPKHVPEHAPPRLNIIQQRVKLVAEFRPASFADIAQPPNQSPA